MQGRNHSSCALQLERLIRPASRQRHTRKRFLDPKACERIRQDSGQTHPDGSHLIDPRCGGNVGAKLTAEDDSSASSLARSIVDFRKVPTDYRTALRPIAQQPPGALPLADSPGRQIAFAIRGVDPSNHLPHVEQSREYRKPSVNREGEKQKATALVEYPPRQGIRERRIESIQTKAFTYETGEFRGAYRNDSFEVSVAPTQTNAVRGEGPRRSLVSKKEWFAPNELAIWRQVWAEQPFDGVRVDSRSHVRGGLGPQ
jgi:hypothetical protein